MEATSTEVISKKSGRADPKSAGRSKAAGVRAGRSDPKQRHMSGVAIGRDGQPRWLKLLNKDPDREYCFAFEGGTDTESVSYFESIGYRIEKHDPSGRGVKIQAGNTAHHNGDKITFRGHVLMSVGRERYDEIQRFGAEGNAGTELTDEMERKVRKNLFQRDAYREVKRARRYAFEDKSGTAQLSGEVEDEGSDG